MSKLFMPVQLLEKYFANWGTHRETDERNIICKSTFERRYGCSQQAMIYIHIIGIPVPQLLSQAFHGGNPTWDQAGVST